MLILYKILRSFILISSKYCTDAMGIERMEKENNFILLKCCNLNHSNKGRMEMLSTHAVEN